MPELSSEETRLESTAETLVALLQDPRVALPRSQGLLVVHTVLVVQHRTGELTTPGHRRLREIAMDVHEYHGEPDGVEATLEAAEAVLDDSITVHHGGGV